jgi:hypothetical protein
MKEVERNKRTWLCSKHWQYVANRCSAFLLFVISSVLFKK